MDETATASKRTTRATKERAADKTMLYQCDAMRREGMPCTFDFSAEAPGTAQYRLHPVNFTSGATAFGRYHQTPTRCLQGNRGGAAYATLDSPWRHGQPADASRERAP
ncbi:hypothetical protein [Robbsia andropogonis]|uniref:hypothetical protein n=1 Tax=Robbsia andropogonis TaxID=28092 RepID=UPI002A6A507D|nr:hypothetical protein [Robbsia andropogonis]